MFSREEKKELNTTFFKRFKHHMSPHRITGGGGGRWEAYKTGVKGLYFRMLTTPEIGLAIDLQYKDEDIRQFIFDQFEELAKLLENEWVETPVLHRNYTLDNGLTISRIEIKLEGAYFYDKKQWPEIMSWYEEKLLGLDRFWETAGDIVKALAR